MKPIGKNITKNIIVKSVFWLNYYIILSFSFLFFKIITEINSVSSFSLAVRVTLGPETE